MKKNDFLSSIIDKEYLLKTFDKDVIFSVTDLAGKIIYASKAFCLISKYSQEELLGENHNIVRVMGYYKVWKVLAWRD